MTQSLVTVVVPIKGDHKKVDVVLSSLDRVPQLGEIVHFMSMVVVPKHGDERAFLLIEISADGHPGAVLEYVAKEIPRHLMTVIKAAQSDAAPTKEQLASYLKAHCVRVGTKWFSGTDGLLFQGTPGMTVRRIKDEEKLSTKIREILNELASAGSALQTVEHIRSKIFKDADYKWAFVAEPVPLLAEAPRVVAITRRLAFAALRDFFPPLIVLPLIVGALSLFWLGHPLDRALWLTTLTFGFEVLVAAPALAWAYTTLRRQEDEDVPLDDPPDPNQLAEIIKYEDPKDAVQNHLFGVSMIKPGLVRRLSLLAGLWLVAEYSRRSFRPGFLQTIGTIHFARWIRLPRTNRLVFLSNYDGSWQSYLEDFIARASAGLTGIWSNTEDFPKTSYLFGGGAKDGPRFKRWARRQQQPTRFWYSAYPQLTAAKIRTNAAIRHGLAAASNELAAARWLALFGYSAPEQVEKEQISALAFGGLPAFPYSRCLLVRFGEPAQARRWLRSISWQLAYGEHAQTRKYCMVAAFTANGLRRLGLDANSLATFPIAFEQGMSAPARARALGDDNAAEWSWGGTSPSSKVDAALVLYARGSEEILLTLVGRRRRQLAKFGHESVEEVELQKLEKKNVEPFGFLDGISQPIMRGSKQWSKPEYSMHVVEPGELVLGYRDNLGFVAPTPSRNGKDIGRNGTFLVMRQLEQHTKEFENYVKAEANRLEYEGRIPGFTGAELEHWVAARMVGRWKDGSSLVRNAHPPAPKTSSVPATVILEAPPATQVVARTVENALRSLSPASAPAPSEEAKVQPMAAAESLSTPLSALPSWTLSSTASMSPPPDAATSSVIRPPTPGARLQASVALPPAEVVPDNDFQYGVEDPDGLRCPLGAHIRRANPRDSLDPGSPVQLAISNRHRILRVGRAFVPKPNSDPGLLFMCINADIERQFEFLQQTWLLGSNFHGLKDEIDPIVGYRGGGDSMTVPTPNGPVQLSRLASFVTVRGGDYFFIPSRSVLSELAS